VAAPTPQLDKAALLQATHAISGTSQYPWVYTNGKAFTLIGDIARPEQFEKSLQQAFKRTNEYRASFRWNRLMFLCLKQLAERDPKLVPDMKHAFAEARAWHQACDELIGMRLPFDIFEPELLLASGDAHRALTKTIELADTAGHSLWNRHNAGVLLTYRAQALRALCQISEAHDVASEAACTLQTTGAVESEWRAWLLVAETTDSHDKRRKAFGAGMAAVEKMRLAPLGWRLDNLYLTPRLPLYQGAILVAVADNDAATALSAIEAVKSRSLAAIIGASSGIAPDADPELVREHAAVDAEISRLQAAILADGASPENDQALQAYRSDRAKLAEQLRQADPRWRAMTSPDPVPLSRIINAVETLEAVAVDLFLHGATLIAVLVADSRLFVHKRELSPSTLAALEHLSRSLSPPLRPDDSFEIFDQTAKDPVALGLALDAILPSPIVARLTKASRVLIAAHGVLHLLPWPVVPVTQGGRRLIEIAEVGMLPNLACVPALVRRPVGTAFCAAIGAPERRFGKEAHRSVPLGARETAAEVAALHSAAGRLVAPPAIGEAATLAAFERFRGMPLAACGILHVTSHGLPPRTEPGDAALLLADGNLEAATIASHRINFDEVVLTACSTGFRPATEAQGVSLAGDDALGLPGALFESGASTLLVSIPLAEMGAAHRMAIGYHRARLAGEPPLAAFRTSQLALLADRAIRPYRACGFVVYGCR
jgi:CHAT domain-containing protein